MIQIVIDIPKEDYERFKKYQDREHVDGMISVNVIANGTPLPEGHGRLIILSEDAVKREQTPLSFPCQNWISETGLSNATVAIIEANKESKEV